MSRAGSAGGASISHKSQMSEQRRERLIDI